MQFNHFLIGALIGLISPGVFAESNWKSIGTVDGFLIGIDTNSIKESIGYYPQTTHKVWSKHVVYEDLIQDGLTVGDYQMILYLVNCETETYGIKSLTIYKKQKNGINNHETVSAPYLKLEDAIPGTVGEGIVNITCH